MTKPKAKAKAKPPRQPARAKRVLVLPDMHFPHEDKPSIACIEAVVRVWDPDEVVVLGDALDCAQFSSHGKLSFAEDRVHGFLADEIEPLNAFLDRLQSRGKSRPDRPLVYLEGNHEQRIERWALNVAGKLGKDIYKLASPRRLIMDRIDSEGQSNGRRSAFKWVPYLGEDCYSHYKIAPETKECTALVAIHGWSIAQSFASVNLQRARSVSVVCGHTHRAQTAESRDPLTGRSLISWSPGCLAKLVPLYQANNPSDWTHGFSLVYIGANGWTPYTCRITNQGRAILPDGTEVHG